MEQLAAMIAEGEIETVILAGCDMQGRLFGKRVPGEYFLEEGKDGIGVTAANLAWDIERNLDLEQFELTNWHKGFHDVFLVPDPNAVRLYPWCEKTAFVMCDICAEDGSLVEVAPRTILKRQVERARKMGFEPFTASELEFFIFKETPESAQEKGYNNLVPLFNYIGDYSIYMNTNNDWFFNYVRNNLKKAGILVEAQKGEWGYGQMEINLRYADALEMADRHAIYKNGLKEMAVQKGLLATFMAKYANHDSGNGMHVHCSFWDVEKRQNVFWSAEEKYNLSAVARHFLGGLLTWINEFFLFCAPYVNSYKRFVTGSFAPTNVTWGFDHRCVALRVAGHGKSRRIEFRAPGADANPYLAKAALIAAGLQGIVNRTEPEIPPVIDQDGYKVEGARRLPANLVEAIELFKESQVVREAFGDAVVKHYLTNARNELSEYFRVVTDWEKKRYFEQI